MNRIEYEAVGGDKIRLFLSDLIFMFNALENTLGAIATAYMPAGVYILYGCNLRYVATDLVLDSGFVVCNGEIVKVPGFTIPAPGAWAAYFKITETVATSGVRQLKEGGGSVNVQFERIGELEFVNNTSEIPQGEVQWDLMSKPIEFHQVIKNLNTQ